MSTLDAAWHDRALLASVARSYYLQNLSRVEIAEEFGISRFKVARLLVRAREEGIVSIEINDSGVVDESLSQQLQQALGLDHCLVVRSHGDDEAVREQIGSAAAVHLSSTLHEDEVLGVAWGRTLNAAIRQIERLPRLTIVQLTGVIAGDLSSSPVELVRQVSQRSGGDVHAMFAPLLIDDVQVAAGVREHPDISAALGLFPHLTTAFLSVGAWNPPDTQIKPILPLDMLAAAVSGGCEADIAGNLIAADGTLVDAGMQDRCISIRYEQLRRVPRVVAVAGGASKAKAVLAVSRANLITELVTDHVLAERVVKLNNG